MLPGIPLQTVSFQLASFHRFVALRYLLGAQGREEGRGFLRFITIVAVGGVAIGVAALLLALSIVRGFSREIENKIVGFGAHVQVESMQDQPLPRATRMERELAQIEAVSHVAPVITDFALLRRSSAEIDGVALWGVKKLPVYLDDHLMVGSSSFQTDSLGRPGLVIGQALSRQLGVEVGDHVTAFSMRKWSGRDDLDPSLFGFRPRVKQFFVAGIYETSLANFDDVHVYTDINVARDLLQYGPDEVTRFDLTLHDVERAHDVTLEVEETHGFPVMARTIYEVFRGLFAWVRLQEAIIPLVIGIIIIVAAFNIVGTLLMIILEKTREIGVLASMGASHRVLQKLFIWLGLFIGTVGTATGLGLALGFALLQQRYGLIPLPEEAYYMKTAPIELNPFDFVLVGAIALLLCVISAYIPARITARIEPLQVIRFS
ncbi:MAG: FtsX-like permease family protein [Rhodothermales bacterium]